VSRTLRAIAAGVLFGCVGLFAADQLVEARPPHRPADPQGFPNVQLQTHDGRTVRFYDDLIKGKVVAINFMYVDCTNF
jgi:protein SCO1/2